MRCERRGAMTTETGTPCSPSLAAYSSLKRGGAMGSALPTTIVTRVEEGTRETTSIGDRLPTGRRHATMPAQRFQSEEFLTPRMCFLQAGRSQGHETSKPAFTVEGHRPAMS